MAKQRVWKHRARPGKASYAERVCPRCHKRALMTIRVMERQREEYWDCSVCGRTSRFSY